MNWMILDKFKERNSSAGLSGQDFTKIMEGLASLFLNAFVDLVENVGKVQIIDISLESKSNEVIGWEGIHIFKEFPLMNLIVQKDMEIWLDRL